MKKISKVGVLGGGLMGSGIAQVSAAAGFPTIVREVSDALCVKSRQSIEKSLAKGIERGKITEAERDKTLGKLRFRVESLSKAGGVPAWVVHACFGPGFAFEYQ